MGRVRPDRRFFLLAAAIVIGVPMIAWWSATRAPSWWIPPKADDGLAQQSAEALEAGLVELATRIDDEARFGAPEPTNGMGSTEDSDAHERAWAVRLTERQINDWLAMRLPAWLRHAGHDDPPQVQIRLASGRIDVGIRRREGWVYRATLRPEVSTEGMRLGLSGGGVGRLPIPRGVIEERLVSESGSLRVAGLDRLVSGLVFDGANMLAFDLGDGRRIELTDIEVRAGELRLRCRTVRSIEE